MLALPNPDWLYQTLEVTGPAEPLAEFEAAAAGAGVTPWVYDYDRLEEDWFLLMASPPIGPRTISIEGARIIARQLRDMVWNDHEAAVSQVGVSKARPFDLHAISPAPYSILRLGPDDPNALAWLWQHWGTTWSLRRVERLPCPSFRVGFFSADWSPWPVIRACRERWPALCFEVAPAYG